MMIPCRPTAATEAARLLRSLCQSDADAVHHQLERIRRTVARSVPPPGGEQERWELLAAVAETLGLQLAERRSSPTTVAACRRLLRHLSV